MNLARAVRPPEMASRRVRIDRLDLLDGRRRERANSRQGAEKARIFAPWRAIWRRLWARSAMSPNCAARHAVRFTESQAISLDKLKVLCIVPRRIRPARRDRAGRHPGPGPDGG